MQKHSFHTLFFISQAYQSQFSCLCNVMKWKYKWKSSGLCLYDFMLYKWILTISDVENGDKMNVIAKCKLNLIPVYTKRRYSFWYSVQLFVFLLSKAVSGTKRTFPYAPLCWLLLGTKNDGNKGWSWTHRKQTRGTENYHLLWLQPAHAN